MIYRPREVAHKLGIAPATLRLWSVRFAAALTEGARRASADGPVPAQRRYAEHDVQALFLIRGLLHKGLTYEEALRQFLEAAATVPTALSAADPSPPPPPAAATDSRAGRPPRDGDPARDVEIARLEEALAARERTIDALRELLEAREKTIATLRDSLDFLNVYLHAVREERDEVRGQASKAAELLARWDQLQGELREGAERSGGTWWRRLLGLD